MIRQIASLLFASSLLLACSQASSPEKASTSTPVVAKNIQLSLDSGKLAKAYFASGCFWCVEAIYESVIGVEEAISGYAGGNKKNPTYQEVGSGRTGHAETVEVYYDPEVVSFETLVTVFFGSHDPTTLNRQGPDRGTAYRSIAFYQNEAEQKIIEDYINLLKENKAFANPIVTEVKALDAFYPAEDYHQDYERNHPNQPYVRSVSIPRLKRFQAKYPELIKQGQMHK